MALTDQQIEQLFLFTKKKLVHHYDLQVELVDHLASSIEEEMALDPHLTFEHALQKVYNRFGIFGFAKVVQERAASLLKSNRRIWLRAVKAFFTIPRIALTALIFLGALYVSDFIPAEVKGFLVFAVWLGFTSIQLRTWLLQRKKSTKKLLLTQYTNFCSFSGIFIPYYIFIIDWKSINNYLFAGFIVVVVIVESAIIEVNKQVKNKAIELYPEAFA